MKGSSHLSNISQRTAHFSTKKRLLLGFLLKKGLRSFPLSFAQERLWFLDQWEPGSSIYTIPAAMRLKGHLNMPALKQSLNEIMQRHESLHTTFATIEGQAVQVIAPALQLSLVQIDLVRLRESEREAVVQALIAEEASCPFDLAKGPLIRTHLLQLGESEQILLLTLHHIISDGWSMNIFIRELGALYGAFSQGNPSPLPPLPIQYADFTLWLRDWLQGEVLDSQLAYWEQQLDGAPTVLELPMSRPRPIRQTFQGTSLNFMLPLSLAEKLKTLSRQEGTTLFMTLLATFQTLLFRYTRQEDILVGTPIANRNYPEVEGLIGFFVNMLVIRTNLPGNPRFREILQQVREVCSDAYAHQDLPFEHLVEALHLERDPRHSPLFQVVFQLQNTPTETLKLPGLVLSPVRIETGTAKFDINVNMVETKRGLQGTLEYNRDLFAEDDIQGLLEHWRILLEGVATDPDTRVENLPLLPEDERRQILVEWNATRRNRPPDLSIHELLEAQTQRTPEKVAAIFGDEQLTYSELNRQANQLARYLQAQGGEPESLVGLLDERGNNLLVAILSVFKTGGAYLPLDPDDPPARLHQILGKSNCSLLLTTRKFAPMLETLPAGRSPHILYWEDIPWQELAEDKLPDCTRPEHLAYVTYTSGSTGAPKGAMIEHRGMLNHLYAKIKDLCLTEADTVAQTASQCFDISVWQFLAALLVGGQVHIFAEKAAHDLVHLLAEFEKNQITIFETVPSLLETMIESIENGDVARPELGAVRWFISTGETLTPELCRRWLELYPHIPVLNAYGATECSDDVTHYPIYQPPPATVLRIPVGRPVDNMQQYVLDPHLAPVPIGVHGEVYFGGVAVGRGYLADPQRTAEAFIADPFSGEPGARLYKTGDLARYLPDGNLDFLGRIDQQVKVRGFRIELGEIEAVLREHSSIRDAVVLTHETQPGNKQLVAYVVANSHPAPNELRSLLREKLPAYMVPAVFIQLEAMPLTSNGKVDRHALPEPGVAAQGPAAPSVAPRTPIEKMLTDIWANLLSIEPPGIYDDFFELGGHSLLATQLVSRIRDALQVEISLRDLFEFPSVADLAEVILQKLGEQVDSEMLVVLDQLSQNEDNDIHLSEDVAFEKGNAHE